MAWHGGKAAAFKKEENGFFIGWPGLLLLESRAAPSLVRREEMHAGEQILLPRNPDAGLRPLHVLPLQIVLQHLRCHRKQTTTSNDAAYAQWRKKERMTWTLL